MMNIKPCKTRNRYACNLPCETIILIALVCIFSLEELQICSNNYTSVSSNYDFIHNNLKCLYISNNKLIDWRSICCLAYLFPSLRLLIVSDNSLRSFRSDNDNEQTCLPNLHTLSIDRVQISEWNDITALTKLLCLQALRIYSAPLFKVRILSP